MDVKPISEYKAPKYPDKRKVLDNPEVLKTLPQRWKSNARAITALSAIMAMSAVGCSVMPNVNPYVKDDGTGLRIATGYENGGSGSAKPSSSKIHLAAPIFDHGSGRGSFGCSSIAPPAFLSEEEAMDVIRAEADSMGISLAAESDGLTLKGVRIPKTKYWLNDGAEIDSTRKGDLTLDGYDADKKIGVEFVSVEDYNEWHTEENVYCSVSDYDFLTAAKLLRDGLEGRTRGNAVGVFYNPMPQLDKELIWDEKKSIEEKGAILKEQATSLLREQVRDFLEWLKGEGII